MGILALLEPTNGQIFVNDKIRARCMYNTTLSTVGPTVARTVDSFHDVQTLSYKEILAVNWSILS